MRDFGSGRYYGLNLTALRRHGTVEFRWFAGTLHGGVVKAYLQLALGIAGKALDVKKASAKPRQFTAENAKYSMRTLLIDLGLIGRDYTNTRMHLVKKCQGNASWKNGRPEA